MAAYHTGSNPIEIGDLGSKVKVTGTQYPFFLHHSMLTALLYISILLCLIKLKFCMLSYALCRSVVEFHKNQMGDDGIVTSFNFSPYNCPNFSNSIEHTNFTEQYDVHLMIKVKVTLTDDKGHRRRSKVTKMN